MAIAYVFLISIQFAKWHSINFLWRMFPNVCNVVNISWEVSITLVLILKLYDTGGMYLPFVILLSLLWDLWNNKFHHQVFAKIQQMVCTKIIVSFFIIRIRKLRNSRLQAMELLDAAEKDCTRAIELQPDYSKVFNIYLHLVYGLWPSTCFWS